MLRSLGAKIASHWASIVINICIEENILGNSEIIVHYSYWVMLRHL
jgi:hypothetical protein